MTDDSDEEHVKVVVTTTAKDNSILKNQRKENFEAGGNDVAAASPTRHDEQDGLQPQGFENFEEAGIDLEVPLPSTTRDGRKRKRKRRKAGRKNSRSESIEGDDEGGKTIEKSSQPALAKNAPDSPASSSSSSSSSSPSTSPTSAPVTQRRRMNDSPPSLSSSSSAAATTTTAASATDRPPPPPEPDAIYCTIRYPTGTLYTGYTLHNLRHGHGIYVDKRNNRYEGTWKNDKAHGHGIKFFATGGKHEGMYVNDKRHGFGKYIWPNEDKYVGEWDGGKMHGRGTFVWGSGDLYEGEWNLGKMHGRGTKRMANGDIYDGQWFEGMAQGWGKKQFSCGDVHEGYYVQDKRQGFGLYVWVNGDRYVGEWRNGRMYGRGVKIMSNGDMYNGEWVLDKAQGHGIKIFSCGDKHEGYYKEDKRDQFGAYTWASGDRYEGEWLNGRMCGLGVKHMANGDVYDGEWYEDQAHGYGRKSFANGDVHEGEYRRDVRELRGVYRWVNGDSYDGEWKKGEQSGIGVYSYANGDKFEGRWESGRKHGPGYFTTTATTNNVDHVAVDQNGQGSTDPEQQESSSLSAAVRIFFEVWSRGARVYREEVSHIPPNDLPTIEDMCRPRTATEIVRFRNKAVASASALTRESSSAQRRPLASLYGETERGNCDTNFADRWRWVWEPAANSGISGFWGRRVRQVQIMNAQSLFTGTDFGMSNNLVGIHELGDVDDTHVGSTGLVSASTDQMDTNLDRGGSLEHEETDRTRNSLGMQCLADLSSPNRNELSVFVDRYGFSPHRESDNVSVCSVRSADFEFPTRVSDQHSSDEPQANAAISSPVAKDSDGENSTHCDETDGQGSGDFGLQRSTDTGSLGKLPAKRTHDFLKQAASSFCSSQSNGTIARRRFSEAGVRLSKRRGRCSIVPSCRLKKARTEDDQPLSSLGDRIGRDPEDAVVQNLESGRSANQRFTVEAAASEEVLSESDLPESTEHARSPTPRHSGGDASTAS